MHSRWPTLTPYSINVEEVKYSVHLPWPQNCLLLDFFLLAHQNDLSELKFRGLCCLGGTVWYYLEIIWCLFSLHSST